MLPLGSGSAEFYLSLICEALSPRSEDQPSSGWAGGKEESEKCASRAATMNKDKHSFRGQKKDGRICDSLRPGTVCPVPSSTENFLG